MELTHVNGRGEARMVDISEKESTVRNARAQAVVRCDPSTIERIASGAMPKGDVFSCARIAGIMAAKRTAELIPMCHPLPVSGITIDITARDSSIRIVSSVSCAYQTGAEMESLTAASVAALTLYDMCKAVDRNMIIGQVMLLSKTGGKSGAYIRPVITAIRTKEAKGAPLTTHETREITDLVSGDGKSPLTLVASDTLSAISKTDGVCTKRFWANIEVSRLPDGLAEGGCLRLGGALCEVSRVGRSCHRLCEAGKAGETCALVREAVALEILKSGTLAVGDEIILETRTE